MPVLGKRLKEARLRTGLSQERLGVMAGIDEMSASARMNQYERDKHAPDWLTMERLAAVLSVPVAYFYAADDDVAVVTVAKRLDRCQARSVVLSARDTANGCGRRSDLEGVLREGNDGRLNAAGEHQCARHRAQTHPVRN